MSLNETQLILLQFTIQVKDVRFFMVGTQNDMWISSDMTSPLKEVSVQYVNFWVDFRHL